MTPQPSPEAVALVQAVIRAERECVEEEERNGFMTPRHWLLVGKLDAASETLLQYITTLEAELTRARAVVDKAADLVYRDPAREALQTAVALYDNGGQVNPRRPAIAAGRSTVTA